jgi:hypothetical protein
MKENHIPLLFPAVKQVTLAVLSVPVIPALLYAAEAEHPLDETKMAVEQSSPGIANA